MVNFSHGKVYGDVVYSIGGSYHQYPSDTGPYEIQFSDIPENANISLARLYLYWYTWTKTHFSPSISMRVNDDPVSPKPYSDDAIATFHKSRYGTYVYDVTDIARRGGNYKAIAQKDSTGVGLSGMLLLVVYEKDDQDKNKPLIEYWIDEGAWVMMANNAEEDKATGLSPEQCTANASFEGVANTSKVSKAELLTVLGSWKKEKLCDGVTVGDVLMFNGWDVGNPIGESYWEYEGDSNIAFTANKWEEVTDYLESTNKAQIQSRGNYMMATNAVLKVEYLPDLTVSWLNAPSSVKGGETRKIEATIRNIGEAKAENFRVRFTASDGTPEEAFRTVDLLEGNNKTTVNFTWTAPDKLGALELIKIQNVTITVEADSEHNVNEENAYGEGENNNNATKDIRVTITEKPLRLSPGGGGPGTGTGLGEGDEAVTEAGATTGGSGEATIGASGGRAITGYLMKGTVARSEAEGGGGGERGEFSLVKLLLRLAMLAVAVVLVCAGYLMERKRQNKSQFQILPNPKKKG